MDLAGGGISPEKLPYIFIKKKKAYLLSSLTFFPLIPELPLPDWPSCPVMARELYTPPSVRWGKTSSVIASLKILVVIQLFV